MVVRCKYAETDKCLKNLKGNQRGKLQRNKKASLLGSSGLNLWKLTRSNPHEADDDTHGHHQFFARQQEIYGVPAGREHG